MTSHQKKQAALAALDLVRPGMTLGIGTGSTAAIFIEALGEKVRAGFDICGIPTSSASEQACQEAGIPLITADETTKIDLAVDGADEIDPNGHLIKGGGAALLREKIIAHAAKHFVVIADQSKDVRTLGDFPLPIEIEKFSYGLTVSALRRVLSSLGYDNPSLMLRSEGGEFVLTDGENYIIDAKLGRIEEPDALEQALNLLPGVVECGLFVGMADQIIIGEDDGVTIREA